MKPPLKDRWDSMSDEARWELLNKTHFGGLLKCTLALQLWLKIKRELREEIEDAYNK